MSQLQAVVVGDGGFPGLPGVAVITAETDTGQQCGTALDADFVIGAEPP